MRGLHPCMHPATQGKQEPEHRLSWKGLLEQEAQDQHVVDGTLAGLVRQDGHEGKQQAHQAVLQYEGANGDLPMGHVGGAAVLQTLDHYGSG